MHVRELSLGSLEVVLLLPLLKLGLAGGSVGYAISHIDKLLGAIERVLGFPLQLPDRLIAQRVQARTERIRAEAEFVEAEERLRCCPR